MIGSYDTLPKQDLFCISSTSLNKSLINENKYEVSVDFSTNFPTLTSKKKVKLRKGTQICQENQSKLQLKENKKYNLRYYKAKPTYYDSAMTQNSKLKSQQEDLIRDISQVKDKNLNEDSQFEHQLSLPKHLDSKEKNTQEQLNYIQELNDTNKTRKSKRKADEIVKSPDLFQEDNPSKWLIYLGLISIPIVYIGSNPLPLPITIEGTQLTFRSNSIEILNENKKKTLDSDDYQIDWKSLKTNVYFQNLKIGEFCHKHDEIWPFLLEQDYIELKGEIQGEAIAFVPGSYVYFIDLKVYLKHKIFQNSQICEFGITNTKKKSKFYAIEKNTQKLAKNNKIKKISKKQYNSDGKTMYNIKMTILHDYIKDALSILMQLMKLKRTQNSRMNIKLMNRFDMLNYDRLILLDNNGVSIIIERNKGFLRAEHNNFLYTFDFENQNESDITMGDHRKQSQISTQRSNCHNYSSLENSFIRENQSNQKEHLEKEFQENQQSNLEARISNQIEQAFEMTQDSNSFRMTNAPDNLIGTLQDYQKQALTWLLYREQLINKDMLYLNPQKTDPDRYLNDMWEEYELPTREKLYLNPYTGQITDQFPKIKSCLGGILGDEMGMGKTVMMIALFHSHKPGIIQQEEGEDENNEIYEPTVKKLKLSDNVEQKSIYDKLKANNLIVVPVSLLTQWENEILKYSRPETFKILIYYGGDRNKYGKHLDEYDIVLTTYDILKRDYKKRKCFNKNLFKYKWFRVVLDEAHVIKGRKTKISCCVCCLKTQYRWCLTGTPIQNNLDDLFSLLRFLKLDTWENYYWWKKLFKKMTDESVQILRNILKSILLRRTKKTANGSLIPNLPPKIVQTIWIDLNQEEREIYEFLYKKSKNQLDTIITTASTKYNYAHIFELILRLRQICNHPSIVFKKDDFDNMHNLEKAVTKFLNPSGLFIEDQNQISEFDLTGRRSMKNDRIKRITRFQEPKYKMPDFDEDSESFDEFYESNRGYSIRNPKSNFMTPKRKINFQFKTTSTNLKPTQENKLESEYQDKDFEIDSESLSSTSSIILIKTNHMKRSFIQSILDKIKKLSNECCPICLQDLIDPTLGKCGHIFCVKCIILVIENSKICPVCRQKISTNDIIPIAISPNKPYEILNMCDKNVKMSTKLEALMKEISITIENHEKSIIFSSFLTMMMLIKKILTQKNIKYEVLDGNLDHKQRALAIQNFNNNKDIYVFLISIRAGSVGLNLVAANHVFLVDPWWNPAIEDQAIERVCRFGQDKIVHVKRFICKRTIEERILELNESKRDLISMILNPERRKEMNIENMVHMMKSFE